MSARRSSQPDANRDGLQILHAPFNREYLNLPTTPEGLHVTRQTI
ncbi:hypothetical protein [Deinococcus sp. ME38]